MKIDVTHIAKLANLSISKGEQDKFEKQLSDILSYVEKLKEVNTKNVEPTSQVTGLENVRREDKTSPSLSQEEALSNTPLRQGFAGQSKSTHNGFFKVKAILED